MPATTVVWPAIERAKPSIRRILKLLVTSHFLISLFINPSPHQVLPLIFPFDFGEDPVDTMDTVSVNCVVSRGDLPIEIVWLFDGLRVTSNDGITVSKMGPKMSTLYIESIRPRHAGNYSCVARNKAGQVEHSSELKVIGNSGVWCGRTYATLRFCAL